jgi:uncharacterized repeat protein (TIGR02543 family)
MPENSGTETGAATYTQGQNVTLTALPGVGYTFINWTENGNQVSTSTSYEFTASENRTLTANFTPKSYSITASVQPENAGTITGSGTFTHGQNISLTATPGTGYVFSNWTENGSQVSTNSVYELTATENKTLIAIFTSTSSVPQLKENGVIILYPNPNNGQFTIQFDNSFSGEINVKISSVTGSIIKDFNILKLNQRYSVDIDLDNVAAGTYYVDLVTKNERITKKLIVNF